MFSTLLNTGDFCETHTAYRLALIHSTCSSNRQSELKVTHANNNSATRLQERHFPTTLRHTEKTAFVSKLSNAPLQSSLLPPPKFNVDKALPVVTPLWFVGQNKSKFVNNEVKIF